MNSARVMPAERDQNGNHSVNGMGAAARELECRGLLLSEDVAVIVHSAAKSAVRK